MHIHGCGRHGRAKWAMAAMAYGNGRGRNRYFGDGWGGHGDRGGFGGRGGRGRVFGSGQLRLVLLRLIADESRHGYELIKAIEEMTGGNYAPSPGVVYPTLSLLTDEGVVSESADGTRKAYAITETGSAELAERSDEADALIARLKGLGEEGERHRAPPIARASANLFAALRGRARSGDFDKDTIHAIAEILDEAAQRIERL